MLSLGTRTETVSDVSPEFFLTPVKVDRQRKRGRRGIRLLVLFSFLLATFGGLFVSGGVAPTAAPKANAFFDVFCLGLNAYKGISIGSWPGASVATPVMGAGAAVSALLDPYGTGITNSYASSGRPITAYEWWGLAGQYWMINNLEELKPAADCSAASITWFGVGAVANIIWQIVLLAGGLAIMIYTVATSANILGIFLDPLGVILSDALNSLYLPFLAPMVMLAALWVAWVGLVKQRSSESIQGVFWVIGAATLSIVFLSNPVFIAKNLNGLVGQLQTVIISTINFPVTGGNNNPKEGLCYAGDPSAPTYNVTAPTDSQGNVLPGFDQASANSQSVISRQFQCIMWETFIFQPWISGTFGELAQAKPNTSAPTVTIAGRAIDPAWGESFALQYLEARTENHDEVVNRLNGTCTGANCNVGIDSVVLEEQIRWLQECYAQPLQNNQPPPSNCTGANSAQQADLAKFVGNPGGGGNQIALSFLALIAIIFAGIPIIILSLKLLFYQLMTVVMLLLAPLYLIVGIHPGFGRRVALGWLEYIINVSIKRVALTFMIAILMVAIQVIINA